MDETGNDLHFKIAKALSDAYGQLHRTIDKSVTSQDASDLSLHRAHDLLLGIAEARRLNLARNEPALTKHMEKLAVQANQTMLLLRVGKKARSEYETSTFRCKSDSERCIARTRSPVAKLLCLALLIRCILKG